MWWLNNPQGGRFMKNTSHKIYFAAGFGGNYIVIIPDKNIVVVTRWLEPKKLDEFLERLYEVI